ncbi:FliM/FliN family flagellar motor C-terminal domain-containing protein [Marinovum sp.]|uniref:FliM/FliN family flagellar motor C-terminal domain-containing protein n=1 Tax=Marinovum sp. TaxID=2024839 RepID=UPI002B276715|nr:FliM/FliN family flagellar motor C-terminal domain-containing protein [Marinovum sp.]
MADSQRKNLLRDLASAARRAQDTREMSPARALRLGLARAAAQLYELPLQVTEVRTSQLSLDEVAEACGEEMLVALLDGPEGARGAVGLSRAMVAALIEVQVIGVVSTLEVGTRRLTPTDAAMVAPWLDAAFERVDHALEEDVTPKGRGHDWMVGYRFGAMAEDGRALALALDAARFRLLRLTVDVALGRRIGEVLLLLPMAEAAERPTPDAGAATGESLLQVPAELKVIAGRVSLPLARAGALQPGDLLPLTGLSLGAAELRSVDGTLAGKARLGRMGEHWAVRFGPAERGTTGRSDTRRSEGGQADPGPREAQPQIPPQAALPRQTALAAPADLPELPPLDFDDPPEGAPGVVPLGNAQDLGNAGFE